MSIISKLRPPCQKNAESTHTRYLTNQQASEVCLNVPPLLCVDSKIITWFPTSQTEWEIKAVGQSQKDCQVPPQKVYIHGEPWTPRLWTGFQHHTMIIEGTKWSLLIFQLPHPLHSRHPPSWLSPVSRPLYSLSILLACNDTWPCVSAMILNVIPWFLFIVNNKSWMINSSPWLNKVFRAVPFPYHRSLRANEFVSMENVKGSNSHHLTWTPSQTEIPPPVRSLLFLYSLSTPGTQGTLFQQKLENLMPMS